MKTSSIWTAIARLVVPGRIPGSGRCATIFAIFVFGASHGSPSCAATLPADVTGCIASAQNRNAPVTQSGDFVLQNLPGSGLVPFGTTDAQPFRVRVTCNGGAVGETALAFPMFEQSVVEPGAIIWGQSTPVPVKLRLDLPSYTISPNNPSFSGQVTASYADGTEKIVTARSAGTGYRSSSAGFVGVKNDGQVFLQSPNTFASIASVVPAPSFVTITAENDGVVSSRIVKLVSSGVLSGNVSQADGRDARGLEVRLSIPGYDDLLVMTDASGSYRFSNLPFAVNRDAQLTVLDRVNHRIGGTLIRLDAYGNAQPPQIVLQGAGAVLIKVVDSTGAPQAGVWVGVSDAYSRAVNLAPVSQPTDSGGQVTFQGVPAGMVSAVSNSVGYAATPGQTQLTAGATAEIVLRTAGANVAVQTSIVGQVLQQPSLTAAVGATIELLEDSPGAPSLRQVVDGSGRFSFTGLSARKLFYYQVKVGGEIIRSGSLFSGNTGSQQQLNIELPALRGLSGIVVGADGQAPVSGVPVQLSYFDDTLGTWAAAGSMNTRADGAFVWRYLSTRLYRLQAVATDGSSASLDVDLSTAAPGTMQSNLRLQLMARPAQVRLSLQATVFGAANFGRLDAELFVKNSVCPSWCAKGRLVTTADTLTTDFLGQGHNDFELRWRGRVQGFAIDVTPANDGQTVSRVIDFGPDASGIARFAAQRSLYSFDVPQGDWVNATVLGLAQDGVTPAAALKYELYAPNGQLLAQGQGFDPARTPHTSAQEINYGPVPTTGRYTLIVSPLNADAVNLGGYGLLTNVANLVVVPQPWAAAGPARFGGQAAGRVFQYNGAPVPGARVVVSAGLPGQLQLVEQVLAVANGDYMHLNLPLGPVVLEATDVDGVVLARAQASLQAEGDRVAQDLHMAARTLVGLGLHVSTGSMAAGGGMAKVAIADAFNNREVQLKLPAGALDGTVEFAVAGDQATLQIGHPSNALLVAERTVIGNDGNRVVVDVTMPTGRVLGKVLYGTSEAAGQLEVSALNRDGVAIGRLSSVADGSFVFPALPANTTLSVQARDAMLDVSKTVDLTTIDAIDVSSGDLVLPTASVSGHVKKLDGTPLSGETVEAAFTGAAALSTTTDATGRYAFARIPAGRAAALTASDTVRGRSRSVNVQGAVGERIAAPDIVFQEGTTVQGRLRTTSGKPLANIWVSIARRLGGGNIECPAGQDNPIDKVMTDPAGNYAFSNVPLLDAVVSAPMSYGLLGCQKVSNNIVVSGVVGTLIVPDLVFQDVASLRLRVVDPMGNAVTGLAGWPSTLDLWSGPNRLSKPLPAAGGDLYESLLPGVYRAEWTSNSSNTTNGSFTVAASQTLTEGSSKNLDVVVPMLRGRIVHSDGSPVTSGSVWMYQTEGWTVPQTIMGTIGGPEVAGGLPVANSFVIAPFKLGSYTLVAQDWVTGLERRWTGRFTTLPDQPMTLVMPGTAQVTGCVTAADGSPQKPGEVRLLSPANGVSVNWVNQMSVTPNAAGCFSFAKVPTGQDVVLQVFSGGLLAWQTLTIPPSANNATVRADIRYLTAAKATCLTAAPETLAPNERASNVLVPLSIEQAMNGGYFDYPALAPVAGNCLQQNALLPGKYRAEQAVYDYALGKMLRGHVLDLQFDPGQEVTAQMPAAATPAIPSWSDPPPVPVGASTYYFLSDAAGTNGQIYAFENTGVDYEWLPVFVDINAPGLLLNGLPLPPRRLMLQNPEPGSREFAMGPYEQGNHINLKRRMYVPDTGGYVRLVETVTNNSNVTQTVKLTMPTTGNDYCSITRTVGLNDSLAASQAGYAGFQNCEGAMLHVHAGAGTAANPAAVVALDQPEKWGGVTTEWSITLSPGQSGSVMHFILAAPLSDGRVDAISPLAEGLANLTDPKMLQGLSVADRALIKNFTVGQ